MNSLRDLIKNEDIILNSINIDNFKPIKDNISVTNVIIIIIAMVIIIMEGLILQKYF